MGREAAGVRGVRLSDASSSSRSSCWAMATYSRPRPAATKLTPLDDFPAHGRGGQGVIALQTSERNGDMVAALQVQPGHELMLMSSSGTLVRTPVGDISVVGRNTQGVRLIRLDEGERLTGVERVESLENGDAGEPGEAPADEPPAPVA
jgi:DNA gyrase subunit A